MIDKQKYEDIFARDKYICQCCKKHVSEFNTPQLAHRIRQGHQAQVFVSAYIWYKYKKDRSKKWCKDYILDNELNLVSTCSLSCNSHFNIFGKPVERDNLIDIIIETTNCLNTGRIY